jgi:hypothetical protein
VINAAVKSLGLVLAASTLFSVADAQQGVTMNRNDPYATYEWYYISREQLPFADRGQGAEVPPPSANDIEKYYRFMFDGTPANPEFQLRFPDVEQFQIVSIGERTYVGRTETVCRVICNVGSDNYRRPFTFRVTKWAEAAKGAVADNFGAVVGEWRLSDDAVNNPVDQAWSRESLASYRLTIKAAPPPTLPSQPAKPAVLSASSSMKWDGGPNNVTPSAKVGPTSMWDFVLAANGNDGTSKCLFGSNTMIGCNFSIADNLLTINGKSYVRSSVPLSAPVPKCAANDIEGIFIRKRDGLAVNIGAMSMAGGGNAVVTEGVSKVFPAATNKFVGIRQKSASSCEYVARCVTIYWKAGEVTSRAEADCTLTLDKPNKIISASPAIHGQFSKPFQ